MSENESLDIPVMHEGPEAVVVDVHKVDATPALNAVIEPPRPIKQNYHSRGPGF